MCNKLQVTTEDQVATHKHFKLSCIQDTLAELMVSGKLILYEDELWREVLHFFTCLSDPLV